MKPLFATITQTETLKSIIQKFTEKPIFLVPNGVDLNKFNTKIRVIIGINMNKHLFILYFLSLTALM